LGAPLFSRASGFGSLFAIVEAEQGIESLAEVRRESGFSLTVFSPYTLIPFAVMNRVYNCAANLSGDCQFGVRVGQAVRLEDFGPFVEYALRGQTLAELIGRAITAQPLHSSELVMDLYVIGAVARWRIRYRTNVEPSVEHHAQRSLMQMLSAVRRAPWARSDEIEIHVAEPYAAEARLLESRLDMRVVPRTNDYELAFPARWLGNATPIPDGPPDLPVEALAAYRDRPLPARMAEAVLVALELHEDLPRAGIDVTAAEFGLPRRSLQHALQCEGASYRDIVLRLRMRRARQLLANTEESLAEVALRTGYANLSNFHRVFLSLNGITPGRFRGASRGLGSNLAPG